MAQSILDIILRTKSEGGTEVKTVIGSITELKSAYDMIKNVYGDVQNAIDELIGEYVKYAEQVDETSRITGMSAEDSSRLIQVTDDLFVSYESLNRAMEGAARNGISMSINSIVRLSDEYKKLNPGLAQSQFLLANFGREGMEMGKVLQEDSSKLREMFDEVDRGLIITEKQKEQVYALKASQDTLNDTWTATEFHLAKVLVPAFELFFGSVNKANASIEEHGTWWARFMPWVTSGTIALNMAKTVIEGIIDPSTTASNKIKDMSKSQQDAAQTAKDLAAAEAENKDQLDVISGSFKDVTAQIIYNKAAAGLDADAALDLARNLGLVNEKSYRTLSALQDTRDEFDANRDGMIDATEAAGGYVDKIMGISHALAGINGKRVYSTIEITQELTRKESTSGTNGHAYGGDMTAGEGGVIGERGPEWFRAPSSGTVISNNQMSSGDVNVYLNLTYSPTVSLADEEEAQRKLAPYIAEGIRAYLVRRR